MDAQRRDGWTSTLEPFAQPVKSFLHFSCYLWGPSGQMILLSSLTGILLNLFSVPLKLVTTNGKATQASQSPPAPHPSPGPGPVDFLSEAACLATQSRTTGSEQAGLAWRRRNLPDTGHFVGHRFWCTIATLQALMSLNTFLPVFQNVERGFTILPHTH